VSNDGTGAATDLATVAREAYWRTGRRDAPWQDVVDAVLAAIEPERAAAESLAEAAARLEEALIREDGAPDSYDAIGHVYAARKETAGALAAYRAAAGEGAGNAAE
jgi:cytochrome c-type biogenesis protein CcmH/NrfG